MSETIVDMPATILPELERMLVLQASRRAGAPAGAAQDAPPPIATTSSVDLPAAAPRPVRRRRRPVSRRPAALALLVALVVASAVAAIRPWSPLLGNRHAGHPTVSGASPGPIALRMLGVLRRAQTAKDRDAQTGRVLRLIGPQLHGVKVPWIRNLEPNVDGMAVTLVPVETYGDVGRAPAVAREGGFLCVLYPSTEPVPAATLNCWSPAQVARGVAVGATRRERRVHVYGLVPDGVASVAVSLADGRQLTAAVRENLFDARVSERPARVRSIRWHDADGHEVGPPLTRTPAGSGRSMR
jgi:hypothetical protein